MNLQTANQRTPDMTRAVRAGIAVGDSTANQLRSFQALGQQMRESNVRTAMAKKDQAMNLRERQQRMDQSADMHPYQILAAQEQIHGQILSNNRTEQQIRQNNITFPLELEHQLARNDEADARAEIAANNLADRRAQAAQAPQFNSYVKSLNSFNSRTFSNNIDPSAIPAVPDSLTGQARANAEDAYADAVLVANKNRLASAAGNLEIAEQKETFGLIEGGFLSSSNQGNPLEVQRARNAKADQEFDQVLGSYPDAPRVGTSEYNQLRRQFIPSTGTGKLNKEGLINALTGQATEGMAVSSVSVGSDGKPRINYAPPKPVDRIKQYGDLLEIAKELREADAAEIKKPLSSYMDDAMKDIYGKSPSETQVPTLSSKNINDIQQYMFARSVGNKEISRRKSDNSESGYEYLMHDRWNTDSWFEANADMVSGDPTGTKESEDWLKKINEAGIPLHGKMGLPSEKNPPKPNTVYWSYAPAGDKTHFIVRAYDFSVSPPRPIDLLNRYGTDGNTFEK